jgi:uncharacterized membrane protein
MLGVKKKLLNSSKETSGDYLPKILHTDVYLFDELKFRPDRKISYNQWLEKFKVSHSLTKDNTQVKKFIGFPNIVIYPPIPYLPQAIGIFVSRLLSFNTIQALYVARIFNLIASLIIIYYALNQLNFSYKMRLVIFFLSGLPMTAFLLSSASGDALTISLSFLLISLGFRLNQSWSERKFLIFLFVTCLLSLSKVPYFIISWMILPAILKGTDIWRIKLRKILFLGVCSIGLVLFWQILVNQLIVPVKPDSYTDMKAQLTFFLQHPLQLSFVFAQKLFKMKFFVNSFIGQLGWYDTFIDRKIVTSYLFILLLCCLIGRKSDKNHEAINPYNFAINIVLLTSIVYLICLSVYLIWTEVGAFYLVGIQGRYLIPPSGLIFLSLPSLYRFKNHHYTFYAMAILTSWLVLSYRVLLTLHSRFWI